MTAAPVRIRFPTQRKGWTESEVQEWLDRLPPLYAIPLDKSEPGMSLAWLHKARELLRDLLSATLVPDGEASIDALDDHLRLALRFPPLE